METVEVWKDVIDHKGFYQVSDLGRVKSIFYNKEKVLKSYFNSRGYLTVTLWKNGIKKISTVHRLVYEAFNGKTSLHVDHIIEGNKSDNRLSNLQAITNRENISKHRLTTNKSSHFTGVHWNKKANKWQSQISINCKTIHLGLFNTELESFQAYQKSLSTIKQ